VTASETVSGTTSATVNADGSGQANDWLSGTANDADQGETLTLSVPAEQKVATVSETLNGTSCVKIGDQKWVPLRWLRSRHGPHQPAGKQQRALVVLLV